MQIFSDLQALEEILSDLMKEKKKIAFSLAVLIARVIQLNIWFKILLFYIEMNPLPCGRVFVAQIIVCLLQAQLELVSANHTFAAHFLLHSI